MKTPSGCKDIAIWKSEFVAKTQFLSLKIYIFEKSLKNGCNSVCHILIFVKKNIIFEHFSGILF